MGLPPDRRDALQREATRLRHIALSADRISGAIRNQVVALASVEGEAERASEAVRIIQSERVHLTMATGPPVSLAQVSPLVAPGLAPSEVANLRARLDRAMRTYDQLKDEAARHAARLESEARAP